MSVIDCPDGQRGFVNAQSLLGSFAPGIRASTVGVPANAETLVVAVGPSGNPKTCKCSGLSSGVAYSGIQIPPNPNTLSGKTWQFDISFPLDAQVNVSFDATPGDNWFVYADAGVHQVADVSKFTNTQGLEYVIPAAPNTAAGDHPFNELQFFSMGFTATAQMLAPAGASARYRIFQAQLAPETSGISSSLFDSIAGRAFIVCGGLGNQSATFPLTGLPLNDNAAVDFQLIAGTGTVVAAVVYTLEQI